MSYDLVRNNKTQQEEVCLLFSSDEGNVPPLFKKKEEKYAKNLSQPYLKPKDVESLRQLNASKADPNQKDRNAFKRRKSINDRVLTKMTIKE